MFSTVVSAHEYTVMFITLVNGLFDHLSGKMGINVRFKLYAIIAVLHLVYLAVFAYTRDQGASGIRQQSVDMHMRDRQQTFDRGTQLVQSLTGIAGASTAGCSPSASSSALFRPKSTGEELFSHGSSHGS